MFSLLYKQKNTLIKSVVKIRHFGTLNNKPPPFDDEIVMFVSCVGLYMFYKSKKPPAGRINFI